MKHDTCIHCIQDKRNHAKWCNISGATGIVQVQCHTNHWFFLSEAPVHVIRSKALQGPLDRLPHILLKRSGLFPRNVYQIDSKTVKQNTKWCSMTFIASLEFWSSLWNRCRLHVSFALFILKNQDVLLVSSPSTRRAKVTCTLAICSKSTRDQNWKLKIMIKYKMHS